MSVIRVADVVSFTRGVAESVLGCAVGAKGDGVIEGEGNEAAIVEVEASWSGRIVTAAVAGIIDFSAFVLALSYLSQYVERKGRRESRFSLV